MAKYFYAVLTRATPGKAEEFHQWYDEQHIKDAVATPGVVSAKRFRIQYEVGAGSVVKDAPYDSLAIYEMDTDDPVAVAKELSGRAGSEAMPLTDALDRAASIKYVTTPAGIWPAEK